MGITVGVTGSSIGLPPIVSDLVESEGSYFNPQTRWSPAAGVSMQMPLKGPWDFVPEVWYTQFGVRFGSIGLAYDSIAVPFLFRRYLGNHRPIAPSSE